MSGYIGVDLDGTLAHYVSGQGVDDVGKPIGTMVGRVCKWLAEGREVRIVTARVSPEWGDVTRQTTMVKAWCVEQFGIELAVQCHKSGDMVELWDDRAIQVVRNDGRIAVEVGLELGKFLARTEIHEFDRQHGIESDAFAAFKETPSEGDPEDYPICVDPVTGDPGDEFFVTVREARSLAASLIRAADAAERAAWAAQAEKVDV